MFILTRFVVKFIVSPAIGQTVQLRQTTMGFLPQQRWSERSFENSREDHDETSCF